MSFGEQLDELIQLHADYHNGKPGLSSKDFKELLIKLIEGKK